MEQRKIILLLGGNKMGKMKTSKKLELDRVKGLSRVHPLKELMDPQQTALAMLECLQNNDPDGAMEMIAIYLEAINKSKLQKEADLPKSTMYSALRHKNPTIKTLAKIMHASTHD